MKLKINKRSFLINTALITIILALIFFFLWQLKINIGLRQELEAKNKEFKAAKKASQHLKELERQIADLQEREDILNKKVAVEEKQPLDLMRTLIHLGGQIGLRGITFSLKEKTPQGQEAQAQTGPQPIYLQMICQGRFLELLDFLEQLMSLQRIVEVGQLKIERKKEILPNQEISLELVTYAF